MAERERKAPTVVTKAGVVRAVMVINVWSIVPIVVPTTVVIGGIPGVMAAVPAVVIAVMATVVRCATTVGSQGGRGGKSQDAERQQDESKTFHIKSPYSTRVGKGRG